MTRALTCRIFSGILTVLVATSLLPAPSRAAAPAESFVQSLANNAVAVLADKSLSTEARWQNLATLLKKGFALDAIGKFALGRYWRTATPEQQTEYQALFERSVIQYMDATLRKYSGETFVVQGVRDDGPGGKLVQSQLNRPDNGVVTLVWRLRESEGSYKVVDLIVEGASLANTRQDEYASTIFKAQNNVDALLVELRRQTAAAR